MGRGPTKEYHKLINTNYVEGTLTCLKPEIIQNNINIDFPLVLNIEPTNACNLHCTCCPRKMTVNQQGINYISIKTFKKIIDEASEYQKLFMLNLHKDGEPLLHKNLSDMVTYAKKRDVAEVIHLNTNGTLLGTKAGKKLLDAGIDDITVSVDAAFPETYRKLKQSDNFDSLIKNIETFIEYRDKINANTTIRTKIMEFQHSTKAEIKAFHEKWGKVADQVQVTGVHNWSGAIDTIEITDETVSNRYPCALLWYALAINSNGKISICNVDWDYSGVVGDINEKSIHHIWNDAKIKTIRNAHLCSNWNYVPVCNFCVVWVSVGNLETYFKTKEEFL